MEGEAANKAEENTASGDARTIVIDNGSDTIKAGFSGDDSPRSIFPTLTGRERYWSEKTDLNLKGKGFYVGEEAQNKRGVLNIKRPVENGIVTHWDDMEKIWEHTFKELEADPKDHPVIHTEPTPCPKVNREKKIQIMFETFEVPAFYVSVGEKLALYATGRTTGVVVGSGYDVSRVMPIYEGYDLPHAIKRFDFAGRDLTHHLLKLLSERPRSFFKGAENVDVNDIKEKLCYVSQDFEKEMKQSELHNSSNSGRESSASYELPGGEQIIIENERFQCPEALFKPSMIGLDSPGLHETAYNSILATDCDVQADFFANIVLCGGNTMFPGMEERMKSEMQRLARPGHEIKIIAPPERQFLAWIGGTLLAGLETCNDLLIRKDEYDEVGPSIVHRKCF